MNKNIIIVTIVSVYPNQCVSTNQLIRTKLIIRQEVIRQTKPNLATTYHRVKSVKLIHIHIQIQIFLWMHGGTIK